MKNNIAHLKNINHAQNLIESDFLNAIDFRCVKREVRELCKERKEKFVERIFSHVLDSAWHDLEKTWDAVKISDEIYADSSLLPLSGGSYIGAPVIFNGMCERAIKENVVGKDVYILRSLKDINWYMIKIDLMKKAFNNNNLYMYSEWDANYHRELIKIDVSKIKK